MSVSIRVDIVLIAAASDECLLGRRPLLKNLEVFVFHRRSDYSALPLSCSFGTVCCLRLWCSSMDCMPQRQQPSNCSVSPLHIVSFDVVLPA